MEENTPHDYREGTSHEQRNEEGQMQASPPPQPRRQQVNVIIMTQAGKPVFARNGDAQEIARMCSLVQALRTSIGGSMADFPLGEIQALDSKQYFVLFKSVEALTFVSIYDKRTTHDHHRLQKHQPPEAYFRLLLEYLHAQLLFTMTSHIQVILQHNPGYDLRSMSLTDADMSMMHDWIDSLLGNNLTTTTSDQRRALTMAGPCLLAAVPVLFPISTKIREKASKALQSIHTENTAFAMLVVSGSSAHTDEKLYLLSLVQPAFRPHQLKAGDLHLLFQFLGQNHQQQPHGKNSEIVHNANVKALRHMEDTWIPVCLPWFLQTGFLYAFRSCLDMETGLNLILISPENTTDQFQEFRRSAQRVRDLLSIPSESENVLTIRSEAAFSQGTSNMYENGTVNPRDPNPSDISGSLDGVLPDDIDWKREESFDEDGFVTIHNEARIADTSRSDSLLLREVRGALEHLSWKEIQRRYLFNEQTGEVDPVTHFLFRVDAPIRNCTKRRSAGFNKGTLSQCLCPPMTLPYYSQAQKLRLWSNYQRLSLRLRLGSSTVESCLDAYDTIGVNATSEEESTHGGFSGIEKDSPASSLLEAQPRIHGVTYVVEGPEMFWAMNGRDFELYMTVPGSFSVAHVAAVGRSLAQRLLAEKKKLFLYAPATWKT